MDWINACAMTLKITLKININNETCQAKAANPTATHHDIEVPSLLCDLTQRLKEAFVPDVCVC